MVVPAAPNVIYVLLMLLASTALKPSALSPSKRMPPCTCSFDLVVIVPTPTFPSAAITSDCVSVATLNAVGKRWRRRVPEAIKDAFRLDSVAPLPDKVAAETAPDAVMLLIENDLLASRRTIVLESARAVAVVRALDSVPVVIEDAFSVVKEAPEPENTSAFTVPFTSSLADGRVTPTPTLPLPRMISGVVAVFELSTRNTSSAPV